MPLNQSLYENKPHQIMDWTATYITDEGACDHGAIIAVD